MDPMQEINMKLDKIMKALNIQGEEGDFEQMSPDGQNRMVEKEFDSNKEKMLGNAS